MRLWPREIRSPGLSLVPVLLGCSIVVPIVLAVLSAKGAARGSAVPQKPDPNAALSEASEKLGQLFRPAILSSFRVRADQTDVAAAVTPVTVGAWVAPRELDPRPGVRFRVSSGDDVDDPTVAQGTRELEFVMDDGERSNGIDDDGDGLIDEGVLWLRQGDLPSVLMANVEMFSVAFEGRSLRVTLGCALVGNAGDIERAVTVRDFLVRNS